MIFGLLLLLIGAALYFVLPGVVDVRLARPDAAGAATTGLIPLIGLVLMGAGLLLSVLGLVLPNSRPRYEHYDHPVDRRSGREREYREEREYIDDVPAERTRTIVKDERGRVKRVETREVRR
jgi:hypothetical protein